jgi:Ca2+-binding RTX toxin-like protein
MSLNRHVSSRRKFGKSKKRQAKSEQQSSLTYQTLEEKRLLAVDIGAFDVTSGVYGTAPNITGGVGPNHIVEVAGTDFRIYDRDGNQLVAKSLTDFWLDTGGAGAQSDTEMVSNPRNARVVYDADTRRWFITSSSQSDLITGAGAEGPQKPILVAVSRTSDPTQDWQSLRNSYDHDNNPANPDRVWDGGFLPYYPDFGPIRNDSTWSTNLAVDDHNIYVSINPNNGNLPAAEYVFNKFSSLVVPTPNSVQPTWGFSSGPTKQWGTEATGTVAGSFGLDTDIAVTGGTSIQLTEFTTPDVPGGGTFEAATIIPVDPYEAPPIFIRQEFDPDLVNAGTGLLSAPVRHGNSLWAAHAVRGDFEAQNPDGGVTANSAIRWYEVDLDTKTVKQSGTIQHEWQNYVYPTISVTGEGHVAVAFTSMGVSPDGPGLGVFPTSSVAVGYSVNGVMTFEAPVAIKDGAAGYLDNIGNFWGQHLEIVADPFNSNKLFAFTEWANSNGNLQTQVTELILTGHTPIVAGTSIDNVITVRRSGVDDTQIEVDIDGVVVGSYEESNLFEIVLDGGGGNDTFVIDTTNGEFDFPGGVLFQGDGDDQVVMDSVAATNWEVFVDGSGEARVGATEPAVCEDHSDVVQTFNLNFEAGSAWFDATPFDPANPGGITRGEVLRNDLQQYFDTVIAPIFSESFSIEIDINDDETDSLASARAEGYGLVDVNGQNLWAASPWSILTGRGDRNGDASDAVIDYNLDLTLYQDNFEALRQNIAGGLTRNQFFRVLGMESLVEDETTSFSDRGNRHFATVMDVGYRDLNDNPIVGNYTAADSTFEVLNYQTNAFWGGDNSGIYFQGIDDSGNPMQLIANSNAELIDFDTLASSLAGTSRDGDFHQIIEQDRAFLRGMGYSLNPVIPVADLPGQRVGFQGIDRIQAGDAVDFFCIRSSNVDLEIRGGVGNDFFNVTGLGVGALDLFGEAGDDTYQVVFSPAGVITISDSINSENDTLIGLGTAAVDTFVFADAGIMVNGGQLVQSGVEDISYNGRESDDVFEIHAALPGTARLNGGGGIDSFIVDDLGATSNEHLLFVSVEDAAADPVDELRLDIAATFVDSYLANEIENISVDGTVVFNGTNGTPTVAGGLNFIGDGDDILVNNSMLDGNWVVDGDGAGNVTIDVDPMTFSGLSEIRSNQGNDIFTITATNTDLLINGRLGDDEFNIANTGTGVVTIDGSTGEDVFNVTNAGGGVNLQGNSGDDEFNYANAGTGSGVIDSGGGVDVVNITDSGDATETLVVNGGDGVDRFTVDNAAGAAQLDIKGGSGNDLFTVINSGAGDLRLEGELDDDTYTFFTINPAINVSVIDSINAEMDSLFYNGGDGDDVFNINGGTFIINGSGSFVVVGVENVGFNGGLGNDTFIVDQPNDWDGILVLGGGEGDDTLTVNNGGMGEITLDGETGNDTYEVFFTPTTDVTVADSGGDLNDRFFGFGSSAVDTVNFQAGTINVNGGIATVAGVESTQLDTLGADDLFTVVSTQGNTTLLGGSGNETFDIQSTSDGDSYDGQDGEDIFNVIFTHSIADFVGGGGNDVFNVMKTDGRGSYFGGDGDDQFFIEDAIGNSNFFGEAGSDFFEVTDHLAKGSTGAIKIDGGANRNRLLVNGYTAQPNFVNFTSTRILGMSAVPIEFTTPANGTFSIANDVGGIELIGSDDADIFLINSLQATDSLKVHGRDGADLFTVAQGALGTVATDGQEGSDLYRYSVGSANNRFLLALDTGVVGTDRIVATLTEGADTINLSGESFRVDTDNFGFNQNFESMIVDTLGGDDIVEINAMNMNFLRVSTSGGDDVIRVNNFQGVNSILALGGDGNDEILVDSGTVDGFFNGQGGAGDDSLTITQRSYGNAFLDGQEGTDTYDVFFADRSDRYVVARDSGTVGNDHLRVHGTVLDDFITMRAGVVRTTAQDVFYNSSTETMTFMAEGSADNISIYGMSAPTVNVMGQEGHDLVTVHSTWGPVDSKTLNIDLGKGRDVANVLRTSPETVTNLFGREGDDQFNLGSSLEDNNGNLDILYGAVNVVGGEDNDFIYINDVGKGSSFDYDIGPTFVRNGGTNSNFFGGITFEGTVETLRLDATNFQNNVEVTPSLDTFFNIVGSGGFNAIGLTVNDGNFFGENGGDGGWTFDSHRDVIFENFFLI